MITYNEAAMNLRREQTLVEVYEELIRTTERFGEFNSYHEAAAVIREEYLELEREIFHGEKGNTDVQYRAAMRGEAIQLAAMAVKMVEKIDSETALCNYVTAPSDGRGGNAPGFPGNRDGDAPR